MENGGVNTWSAREISLRAQKKFLSHVGGNSTSRSFVLDDHSARLLDQLLKVLRDRMDKKEAEKMVKYVIKVVVKIGVLRRHNQLSQSDERELDGFRSKFHTVLMAIISFCEVDFSYDRTFLQNALIDSHRPLKRVLERHLSEKSVSRIANAFNTLSRDELLDSLFQTPKDDVTELVIMLRRAMDRGFIV